MNLPPVTRAKGETGRWVGAGCVHVPHHDPKAVALLLAFLRWYRPTKVDLMGDIADFYAVSSHEKSPWGELEFQREIGETRAFLGAVRKACPKAAIRFMGGNHEDRLRRYLWGQSPALAGMEGLTVESLFGLKELGVKWSPYQRPQRQGSLAVEHGDVVSRNSGATALAMATRRGTSGASAHSHRQSLVCRTDGDRTVDWVEVGTLARMDPEYVIGTPNWQQGFACGSMHGRHVEVELVRIRGGVLRYRGLEWRA